MTYTSVIGINYVIHGFQSKQTCGLQSLFGNVQVGTRVLILERNSSALAIGCHLEMHLYID